jgi:DNA-binding NtrC family response regulator
MVGTSEAMREVFRQIRKVAASDAPILISGESGTGKELAALAIHERSARAGRPFVPVDCAAIPSTLVQSELFGYEKGAFTGATARKLGRIEAAEGGTLFLDEIGDLPLDQQGNLLRFLQESTIQRVGATRLVTLNVRVIAASHISLQEAVRAGRFREDLYYRLNVLRIHMPALCERMGDIEVLARYFLGKFAGEAGRKVLGFTPQALDLMRGYGWPGNIRELINRIRRAIVMCDGPWITPADLDLQSSPEHVEHVLPLDTAREIAERQAIRAAMEACSNNHSAAARVLGISRPTFYRLLEKYREVPKNAGLQRGDWSQRHPH